MSLLDSFFGSPRADSTITPIDDRWYAPFGLLSAAGIRVDDDAALRVSAVFNAVRIISETVASLPLPLFQRLPDGGKVRVPEHPLYAVLHDTPNHWQTSFQFREFMQGVALLRGNAYAEILSGPRGFVDQLIPLHPNVVEVERLPNGRLRYQVTEPTGKKRAITQDRMFHISGFGSDGIKGISVVRLMRETVGMSLATESFGARVYSQRGNHSGILEFPDALEEETFKRLKAGLDEQTVGLDNAHGMLILENGMTWKQVGMNLEDAQFLLTRTFEIQEVARWFNLQPHKLADLSKSSFNNIEEQGIDFVTDTIRPWNVRWEQTIFRDLITRPDLFAEFIVDALLRGKTKERFAAYQSAIFAGWMNRNEVRMKENLNRVDGLDEYLEPQNMRLAGDDRDDEEDRDNRRDRNEIAPLAPGREARLLNSGHRPSKAERVVYRDATRMVRKEISALTKLAQRCNDDKEKWKTELGKFYEEHASTLCDALFLAKPVAEEYCAAQHKQIEELGLQQLEQWEATKPNELTNLALSA